MSYVRKLLYAIADELKRPHTDFDKYVGDLEANWYDSKQALMNVNDNELYRIGLPGRLVQIIREKLGQPAQQQQVYAQQAQQQYGQQGAQQYPQQGYQQPQYPQQQYAQQPQQPVNPKYPQSQKPYPQQPQYPQQQYAQQPQYPQQPKQSTTNSGQSRIQLLLNQLRKRLNNQTEFLEVTDILKKIFFNVQHNLQDEKYRTVKKGNTFARLARYDELIEVMRLGGFEDVQGALVMRQLDLSRLNLVCDQIERNSRPKFNPYQAQISSITGLMGDMGKDSVNVWAEKLDELNKERERLMSLPVKNRDVRISKYQTQGSFKKMMEKEPEESPNEDQRIFLENIKNNLKRLEQGANFSSKRKAEYQALLKVPCFSQTLIRVQLPNNILWECRFSPAQKLSKLVQIFEQYMINPKMNYFLFMTPPVQRVDKKMQQQTFYELGCVPRALFYFGSDDPIKGDIIKTQSGNFKTYQ